MYELRVSLSGPNELWGRDALGDLTMRCILIVLCFAVCWMTYLLLHALRSAHETSRTGLSPMADRRVRGSQTVDQLPPHKSTYNAATVAPHFKATVPINPMTTHTAEAWASTHSAFGESDDGSSRVHVV